MTSDVTRRPRRLSVAPETIEDLILAIDLFGVAITSAMLRETDHDPLPQDIQASNNRVVRLKPLRKKLRAALLNSSE